MESIENINQIIEDNDFIDENGISLNNKNENIESNLNINNSKFIIKSSSISYI